VDQSEELLVPLVNAHHQREALEHAFSAFSKSEMTVS
jgi:hypothetical protein